jgi:hypothetical protein
MFQYVYKVNEVILLQYANSETYVNVKLWINYNIIQIFIKMASFASGIRKKFVKMADWINHVPTKKKNNNNGKFCMFKHLKILIMVSLAYHFTKKIVIMASFASVKTPRKLW